MKKYKYKREHFASQADFDRFRENRTNWAKKWLRKHEEANPEHRERRLLRQCLYSRYHYNTDCRQSFNDWLKEAYGIEDIRAVPIEQLRAKVSKS